MSKRTPKQAMAWLRQQAAENGNPQMADSMIATLIAALKGANDISDATGDIMRDPHWETDSRHAVEDDKDSAYAEQVDELAAEILAGDDADLAELLAAAQSGPAELANRFYASLRLAIASRSRRFPG